MAVERKDLLEIARKALSDSGIYQIKDIHITYFQRVGSEWRISIFYEKNIGGLW